MNGLSKLLVLSFFLFHGVLNALGDTTLVEYGFDGTLPSAKDGFLIFENTRGFVEPTTEEKFSGYKSLQIKEEPLDNGFVELQGLFDPVISGDLLFHFAIFIKNPEEELNIAIAGPEHFYMKRDGMFFWLKTLNGNLHHHADGIPKRIGKLEASTWYVVDAVFHIEEGTYDLRVVNSTTREVLALVKEQPNATHSPGSRVSKLSFIGDLEDRSAVNYFVDDVELRILSTPFDLERPEQIKKLRFRETLTQHSTPPGDLSYVHQATPSSPRKGYLEEYKELRQLLFERPTCLPATNLTDFGISTRDLQRTDNPEEIRSTIKSDDSSIPSPETLKGTIAKTIAEWRLGCLALASGDFRGAKIRLNRASELSPHLALTHAALAMTSLALKDRVSVESELSQLYKLWSTDARLPVLLGAVTRTFDGYEQAVESLKGVAQQMSESQIRQQISTLIVGDDANFDELRAIFKGRWKNELDDLYIGQGYYFSLLFADKPREAAEFARKLISRYQEIPRAQSAWKEREADALAFAGELAHAKEVYRSLVDECPSCKTAKAKLADLEGR